MCVHDCLSVSKVKRWSLVLVGKLLKDAWGTSLLADPSMFGTMVLVELPDGLLPRDSSTDVRVEPPFDDKSAELIQDNLHYDYKIEVYKLIWNHVCTVSEFD